MLQKVVQATGGGSAVVSATIHGAYNDVISCTAPNGEIADLTLDSLGNNEILLPRGNVKIYSPISQYEKDVDVSNSGQEIYVMPDNAVYFHGVKSVNFVASGTYTTLNLNQVYNSDVTLMFYSFRGANASGYATASIDLTNFNTLTIHMDFADGDFGKVNFFLDSTVIASPIPNYAVTSVSDKTYTVDVSSMSGAHNLVIEVASGSNGNEHATVYIDEILLS